MSEGGKTHSRVEYWYYVAGIGSFFIALVTLLLAVFPRSPSPPANDTPHLPPSTSVPASTVPADPQTSVAPTQTVSVPSPTPPLPTQTPTPAFPLIPSTWVSTNETPMGRKGQLFLRNDGTAEVLSADQRLPDLKGTWAQFGITFHLSFDAVCAIAVASPSASLPGLQQMSLTAYPLSCRQRRPCRCFDNDNALTHDWFTNLEMKYGGR